MSPLAFILVGPAGAAGALARFGLDRAISQRTTHFGLGIVCVNTLACFLMGLVWALAAGTGAVWAVCAGGFLGGMSTFSTAVLDVAAEVRTRPLTALGLVLGGLATCSVAFLAGWGLAVSVGA